MPKPKIIKYAEVLDKFHREFENQYIETEVVQLPTPDNGEVAVMRASVGGTRGDVKYGPFHGTGDASPENVSRQIVPHIIRQAETRAKARALKDCVNIEGVLAEDASDHYDSEPEILTVSGPPPVIEPPPEEERPEDDPITDAQSADIIAIAEELGDGDANPVLDWLETQVGVPPEMMTRDEAQQWIHRLNKRINAKRRAAATITEE